MVIQKHKGRKTIIVDCSEKDQNWNGKWYVLEIHFENQIDGADKLIQMVARGRARNNHGDKKHENVGAVSQNGGFKTFNQWSERLFLLVLLRGFTWALPL